METEAAISEMLSGVGDLIEDLSLTVGDVVEDIIVEAVDAVENGCLPPNCLELLMRAEKLALEEKKHKKVELTATCIDPVFVIEAGTITDVDVGLGNKIHTICFRSESQEKDDSTQVPLVMLHGLGGGLAAYHKNYTELCHDRDVYGIDLPGFALSSMVEFSGDAEECRNQFVNLIEKWRVAMGIEKFCLLGHSFGGYISANYAVQHPSHVHHLVLVDPWGILPKEEDESSHDSKLWEMCAMEVSNFFKLSPFDSLRHTGLFAPLIGNMFMPDRIKDVYGTNCAHYFLNAIDQDDATGEKMFSIISDYEYLWAKHPMKAELIQLDASVPITFIYGEKSPFYNDVGQQVKAERRNVFLPEPIPDIGHHLHVERPDLFNKLVNGICCTANTSSN